MAEIQEYQQSIQDAVEKFRKLKKNGVIRIITHLDTDGLCAASIAAKALSREKLKYSISILPQLDTEMVKELSSESHKVYLFTDLGSGKIKSLSDLFVGKIVFILDHHKPSRYKPAEFITHVNPHLYGFDGSKEISGSGVVYQFAKVLNLKNKDRAFIAVIGAIGDSQENMGFRELNSSILQDAISSGILKVKQSLRIFGSQSKPLHKLLEYCYSPYIPGVTNSEYGSLKFLKDLGINPRVGNAWKKVLHLTDEEIKRLSDKIQERRIDDKEKNNIFGPVYLLPKESEGPFRDAREYSTLLNACGRMGKGSIGIGACLGDTKLKKKSLSILRDYRREIVNALNWFTENKQTESVLKSDGYILINAKDSIPSSIIGTLASIISNSGSLNNGTVILAMARTIHNKAKVSLRTVGNRSGSRIDLKKIAEEIIHYVGSGEAGGHKDAAGALLPIRYEKKFIEQAKRILNRVSMEELVN